MPMTFTKATRMLKYRLGNRIITLSRSATMTTINSSIMFRCERIHLEYSSNLSKQEGSNNIESHIGDHI